MAGHPETMGIGELRARLISYLPNRPGMSSETLALAAAILGATGSEIAVTAPFSAAHFLPGHVDGTPALPVGR